MVILNKVGIFRGTQKSLIHKLNVPVFPEFKSLNKMINQLFADNYFAVSHQIIQSQVIQKSKGNEQSHDP